MRLGALGCDVLAYTHWRFWISNDTLGICIYVGCAIYRWHMWRIFGWALMGPLADDAVNSYYFLDLHYIA